VSSAVAVAARGPLPVARWAGLGGLLLAELLALTLRFDTGSLSGDGRWWAPLLGEAHYLPQLALTAAAALALFGADRLRRAAGAVADRLRDAHDWGRPLGCHLAAFAAFAVLTRHLIEGAGAGTAAFAGWLAAGAVLAAGWCLAALPEGAWRDLIRRLGWEIAALVAIAVLAGFGAGRLTEPLWDRMADGTLAAARAVLALGAAEVTCDPAARTLGVGGFVVRIAPSCSGYEGLGLVAAFAGLFLVLRRNELRFPQALLLLPAGLAAAWAANVLRIAALVALGAAGWPEVALGGFHSQAGWLGFLFVALGVVAAGKRSRFFAREAPAAAGTVNPSVAYLAPLVAVVGSAMLTSAFSAGGLDALYAVRVFVAGAVVWRFRAEYARLGWSAAPGTAIGIGLLVFALWLGFGFAFGNANEESTIPAGLAAMPGAWAAAWLALRVVGAVVIVPLAEELAFRGFLLRWLQSADFDRVPPGRWSWPAVLGSSVLFGLLHPGWWVAGTLAGVAYAAAYRMRGRLADAVVAHAVTNALIAAFVLATGSWWLW
jgi:exosortase E/protease (VPEID-CTERM system)